MVTLNLLKRHLGLVAACPLARHQNKTTTVVIPLSVVLYSVSPRMAPNLNLILNLKFCICALPNRATIRAYMHTCIYMIQSKVLTSYLPRYFSRSMTLIISPTLNLGRPDPWFASRERVAFTCIHLHSLALLGFKSDHALQRNQAKDIAQICIVGLS